MNAASHNIMARPGTMTGIACGIGAGALWGLVFLAPAFAGKFSALELTIGRYMAYGLIAASLIIPRWSRLRSQLKMRDWRTLALLALTGNTLYYILLANAVQMGGIAMTSLIIGFIPVAVTIIGSRDKGAVPLKKLTPSLLLCVAGTLCIGWQAIATPSNGALTTQVLGLVFAVGALACWTYYAVANSRALTRIHSVSAHDWSLLIGIIAGAQTLALIPVAMILYKGGYGSTDWMMLAGVCAGLAIMASIMGNALWNRMSRLLPLTLAGQMVLFETLFALIYGFIWEERWPTTLESAAFVLVVLSVVSCMHSHRQPIAPH